MAKKRKSKIRPVVIMSLISLCVGFAGGYIVNGQLENPIFAGSGAASRGASAGSSEDMDNLFQTLMESREAGKEMDKMLNSGKELTESDMMKLQSLMDKRNQAFEQASNLLEKDQKTRDSIIGNQR